ncbi:PH domain-containing protein [Sphingomicrobium astaxanthinifaciens]|uniref:PH domain-containing protein n=1 Tax=Sphingomicrobium astaxanthinifaciens TaxID=1227949 RepID=UPI001FCA65A0|nr:PH domain-containing protein [Sphingomicrobium astaxanthinifaciens]MCJ7420860.1 PH domain-containing protein [Sphingomicrobium astaxanthinifaciens]
MTEATLPTDSDLPATLDPRRAVLPPGLEPVEPSYRWALRLRLMLGWLPLLIGALVLDSVALEGAPLRGLASGVVALVGLAAVVIGPQRIWRRLGYALGERELRIVRGWLFHVDTIVPFVRVQHLDVARAPLDKLVGTASLIIHTAGTHNSVVTLPGLAPPRAIELRDRIRAQIKTDWQ